MDDPTIVAFDGGPLDGQTHSLVGVATETMRFPKAKGYFLGRRSTPYPEGEYVYRRSDDGKTYEFVEESGRSDTR